MRLPLTSRLIAIGRCPIAVTSKYWAGYTTRDVHDQACVACRFDTCSDVMCPPKQFYDDLNQKRDASKRQQLGQCPMTSVALFNNLFFLCATC